MRKDFRNLNEEEFIEIFNILKSKTNNFKSFYSELILENNQYLLIIRICLGLSQRGFAKALGRTKDWCRHIEARRNKIIHKKIAERYTDRLEDLIQRIDINLEDSLKNWKDYIFAREQKFTKIKTNFKQISKLDEKELKKFFDYVKNKTENFKVFNSKILLESPQSVLIFRLAVGLNHRKFASSLYANSRAIRKYENGEMKIKISTAEKFIKIIQSLFRKAGLMGKVNFENILENFRIMKGFYGHRNLDSMIDAGINRLAKLNKNKFENEIEDVLTKNKINFERFAIVEGVKRKYNVDFAIPNSKNPKVIIEAFEFTVGGKSRNYKTKVSLVDHRFQMFKIKNNNIKTVMMIRLIGRPILKSFVRKSLELETINTNFLLINEKPENALLGLKKLF